MSDLNDPDPIEWKPWWSWALAAVVVCLILIFLTAMAHWL